MSLTQTDSMPAPPAESYRLGPFEFLSELPLPELVARPAAEARHRVTVTLGPVPVHLAGQVRVDPFCSLSPSEFLLHIPGTARYYARAGAEVRVEPEDGAHPEDIRIYLLGSVFGILCYQLGYLPLHASAVRGRGGVVALLGDSGAGKSTLASFLARRGVPVVADDICLLESTAGRYAVVPVAGWLKLWRETMDRLGDVPEPAHRVFSRHDKYRVYLPDQGHGPQDEATPLSALVFLDRPDQPDRPDEPDRPDTFDRHKHLDAPKTAAAVAQLALEPLAPAEALVRMMGAIYLPYVPEALGTQAELFRFCGGALHGVRALRLVAPMGWDFLEATLDLLQEQLLDG